MSSICVTWQGVQGAVDGYSYERRELSALIASLRGVKSYHCLSGQNFSNTYKALDRIIQSLDEKKTNLQNLESSLSNILKTYESCENNVMERFGDQTSDQTTKNPFSCTWKDTWKMISKVGIIGSATSAFGRVITEGWSPQTGISSAKDMLSVIGEVSSTVSKGSSAKWGEALFGMNNGLKGLDQTNVGTTFISSIGKSGEGLNFSKASSLGGKVKVATKWGGHLLSLASNYLDNKKEFEGQKGMESRMIAETGIETAVDIGIGVAASATVSATASALLSAGIITCAPAVVIGAGTVAVTWAANGICKWATGGKDIGEVVSDIVCDVGGAVKKVGDTIAKWGKSLFSWGK